MSTEHSKRAAKFTQNVEKTTWHDATFWSVRQKRDKMAQELPEWEDLREHASEIKMHTITHLADYLDMFSKNLESLGVKVHWAKDAQEFNEIVLGILKDHNVKKMVKTKSMLTEECEMNPVIPFPITRGLSFLTTTILSGYKLHKTSIAKLPFKSLVALCTDLKNLFSSSFVSFEK